MTRISPTPKKGLVIEWKRMTVREAVERHVPRPLPPLQIDRTPRVGSSAATVLASAGLVVAIVTAGAAIARHGWGG